MQTKSSGRGGRGGTAAPDAPGSTSTDKNRRGSEQRRGRRIPHETGDSRSGGHPAGDSGGAGSRADRTARRHSSRTPLAPRFPLIPRIAPEIPGQITVTRSLEFGVRIAEALIAADVIPEEYPFEGDVMVTLHNALRDVVKDDVGYIPWLQLELHYSDDSDNVSISAEEWLRFIGEAKGNYYNPMAYFDAQNDPKTPRVGYFALHSIQGTSIYCKEFVEPVEAMYPGAGYAMMAVLHDTLHYTIGVACLEWILDSIMNSEDDRDPGDAPEETGRITSERFQEVVPYNAIYPKWDRAAVERVVEGEKDGEQKYIHDAAVVALKLHDAMEAFVAECTTNMLKGEGRYPYGDAYCQAGAHEEDIVKPFVLAWTPEDGSNEEIDDYHEMLGNCGYSTCVWFQGFALQNLPDTPFTLERAARVLKALLLLLNPMNALIGYLSGTQPERQNTPSPEWVMMLDDLKRRGVVPVLPPAVQFAVDQADDLQAEREISEGETEE